MVSRSTAERIPSRPAGGAGGRPLIAGAPRRELRWTLLGLFAVAMGLTATRSLNYVPYWTIPMVMVWFRPAFVAKVLVFFVAVLLLIGGLLTTYRAGMAYEQWPRTGESWMHEYPLSQMLADGWGGILEHSHRLWASALGLVAIGAVASAHVHRARRGLIAMAWATLAAITVQGIIGGTRVLEVSQNLAFLHGVIAQAVVAMIVTFAVMASRSWTEASRTPSEFARGAHGLGPWVVGLLYVQFALGAWLRHHGQTTALLLHGTYALFVVVMVLVFAKQLGVAGEEGVERRTPRRPLIVIQRLLLGSVALQFLLGVLATLGIYFISGGMQAEVSVGEAVFATGHVLVGAALFSTTVVGALFARRMLAPEPR